MESREKSSIDNERGLRFPYKGTGAVFGDSGGWIFIEVDKSIILYYSVIARKFGINLNTTDDPHITVVAGKYEQAEDRGIPEKVEFRYGKAYYGDSYFWLDAECDWAREFRIKNGLKPYPKYQFHITIGKIDPHYGKQRIRRHRGNSFSN